GASAGCTSGARGARAQDSSGRAAGCGPREPHRLTGLQTLSTMRPEKLPMTTLRQDLVHVLLAVLCAGGSALAPGAVGWLPGEGTPGVAGTVRSVVQWDPDGPGPATPVFVFGGSFSSAGTVTGFNQNLVVFDPASGTWSRLGAGVGGGFGADGVYALAAMP